MSPGVVAALGAGPGPLVVAEVAQAHDGSLGTAHAYIDAVARAGADAVKFQTHLAHAESTRDEPWRVRFSPQDESRYAYWERMAFTADQWAGLRRHAADAGLAFLSSPFSHEAVALLEAVDVDGLKIASGEVANLDLVRACGETGRPVLVSSGMSPLDELDRAVACLGAAGAPAAVLQCSSAYPCPPEEVGLNVIPELAARYDLEVGLSDHSGTIYPSIAAVALGASVLEVHVTLSREAFGPDVASSVTTDELRQLVDGARFVATSLAHPIDKDAAARDRADLRAMFTRRLVAAADLAAGHLLGAGDLAAKKPGDGIPPDQRDRLVGRRLRRAVQADEAIREDDLEPEPSARQGAHR